MITKTERSFFNAAKAVSELSDHPQYKLGCVVVLGHRIVSSGKNSHTKCHALQAKLDKEMFGCECRGLLHSEVDALRPLINNNVDLSRASVYVYRQHKNGTLGLAKPCPRCMKLIKQCGIKKVYYTTEGGYANEIIEYEQNINN
jgi:deoxycytidylate deaminase